MASGPRIRVSRVLAIARQDLAAEFKGRQGLILPGVVLSLLLPAAAVPSPVSEIMSDITNEQVQVSGDVPPEILALPDVVEQSLYRLRFEREDGVLLLKGRLVPMGIRRALDGDAPAVTLNYKPRGYVLPSRTMLLSLITASTLTGAVSQSIGGERSRKTLVVLLAAAVSRAEIVLGKWVAWGGFGAGASLLAAALLVLAGNAEPGMWLVALPLVPLSTVALGLWLVRRAGDVMAGSATTLRVLPAAMSILAVGAWFLGDSISPWVGAAIPLGGALIASGSTWTAAGVGPPLLATASAAALTVAALAGTIRDLEESSDREPPEHSLGLAAAVAAVAGSLWWTVIAGPELWRLAGNQRVTEALEPAGGIVAGTAVLALVSLVRVARSVVPPRVELGLPAPTWRDLGEGLAGAAVLAGGWALVQLLPPFAGSEGAVRLANAVQPGWAGAWVAVPLILADELLFRGWLQRATGPAIAIGVWLVVRAPTDPVGGLLIGVVCAFLARGGRTWGALIARLAWLVGALVAAAWAG